MPAKPLQPAGIPAKLGKQSQNLAASKASKRGPPLWQIEAWRIGTEPWQRPPPYLGVDDALCGEGLGD